MRARGHHVAFATSVAPAAPPWLPLPEVVRTGGAIPAALARDGFEVVPLGLSLRSLRHAIMVPMSRGYTEMRHALSMFGADAVAQARTLAAAIDRHRADVVVGDYLMASAYLAARLKKRPFVAFYHSALPFPGPDRPPFGSGLPHHAPRDAAWAAAQREVDSIGALADRMFDRACNELGVPRPARRLLSEPYSESCNLLATTPELEPGLPAQRGPVHFVGPCLEGREEDEAHPALDALRTEETRVYVSMGTVFNTNRRVFESILHGLDRPGVRVVVSAGASHAALEKRPPTRNARFFARVPQLAVLRAADVVIGHGGNNSTLETLAAGKPLIVVPFGGDQLENARRVEALGSGVAVLPGELHATGVRAAYEQALGKRARAEEIAASLRGVDGTARSVAIIEELAGSAVG